MKLRTGLWLFGCLVLALGGAAEPPVPIVPMASLVAIAPDADDASGPYAVISERNMFHLNPVPPETGPEPPKVELPVVKFSGFFRVGSVTKALFCSLPKDKKEEPSYYNLSEGEKSGFLEVVKIHFEKGEVEVVNSGVAMTLTLKDDSLLGKQEPSENKGDAHRMHEMLHKTDLTPEGPRGFSEGGAKLPPFPGRQRRTPVPP
jgi:hypothetical protein